MAKCGIIISTLAAGVAPGTASSTTPPFSIWNPPDSSLVPRVAFVTLGYVSGTLGAGTIVAAIVPQLTVPTGGTELVCTPDGLPISRSGIVRAYTGATLSAAPALLIGTGWSLGAFTAATASIGPALQFAPPTGLLRIPAGYVLAFHGVAAAGTSPLVLFGAILSSGD